MDLLTHNTTAVVSAACHCLGQVGRRNDLPFPNRNLKDPVKYGDFDGLQSTETARMMDVDAEPTSGLTQLKIIEKLLDLAVEKNIQHKVRVFFGSVCVLHKMTYMTSFLV